MTSEDLQLYRIVLETINAIGVVGILLFFLLAFYKGYIIPKSVLDDIVVSISAELMQKIDDLMERKKNSRFF